MTRFHDKELAIKMRHKGKSYNEIKDKLKVSKSTLSYWLRDMPLSRDQVNTLRAYSPKRIERFRNTMREKRDARLSEVYKVVSKDLGKLSKRDIMISGFFLYWGEGGKTKLYTTTLANTDPQMIRFYIRWLQVLKVDQSKIKIRLQLYSDMDISKEISFWSKVLSLEKDHFVKPYIKKTARINISYRGFGHGTCNVIVDNRDISEYVLQGLRYISSQF